jgi:hypothetical protein
VWTGGILAFNNVIDDAGHPWPIAYLGGTSGFDTGVCIDTQDSVWKQMVLARQTGLLVGVHGLFHRVPRKPYSECRNGTISVTLIEIGLED